MKAMIIGGGDLSPAFLKDMLKAHQGAILIAADRGAEALYAAGRKPDHLLGDFDSASPKVKRAMEEAGSCVEVYPAVKDFTDSEAAIYKALELGSDEIYLLGMTGGRLDHFMANVHNLLIPFRMGVKAVMADELNRISLIGTPEDSLSGLIDTEEGKNNAVGLAGAGEGKSSSPFAVTELVKNEAFGKYVSLLPFYERAEGVTLEGFYYPLKEATVVKGSSLCISNEITAKRAKITVGKGIMILILSKDR